MDHSTQHSGTAHGHSAPAGGHGTHAHGTTWATAMKATLHCLTGCAIGEILGMVIGTALLWGNVATMALAITLAFVFGYSFTLFAVVRAGVSLKTALKDALAADTVSIAVMELVDNGIIALAPGAMDTHLSDGLFWYAQLGGFAVAFVITTPVNKWMIGRGKGHAVVHA
ncbi:DUF4396 domain-containing protein [Streptomyces sp. RM72]|uniref:DUF4396 domain-containing protein n=1 Tax=Streptomyces sp. RM72 TaxID=1115510 RepID=UPI001B379593|nr:DUF4396 domain-containing protein [Streptomyces sp. RM72]MBQ0891412.1 DUF4396 domain-containing protein [Streptomyces sp. RM72]